MTFNVLEGNECVINSVRDSSLPFQKDAAYYFGETHNGYTRLVGDGNTKASYTNLRWRPGDTWYSPVLDCYNDGVDGNYHNDCNDGDYTFSIWDSR